MNIKEELDINKWKTELQNCIDNTLSILEETTTCEIKRELNDSKIETTHKTFKKDPLDINESLNETRTEQENVENISLNSDDIEEQSNKKKILNQNDTDPLDINEWRQSDIITSVHKGLKNHKCELCDKDFSRSDTLKIHINSVHKGLKNQKCELCDK